MVPPFKRRKLSSSSFQNIYYLDDHTDQIPSPSPAVETHPLSSCAPSRTDFVNEREKSPQFAPVGGIEHFKAILPREASVPSPTLASMPSPTLTSWMNLPSSPTLPSVPITSASVAAATLPAGVSPSESSSSPSPASDESSRTITSEFATLSTGSVKNSTTSLLTTTDISHTSSTILHTNATVTTTSIDTALEFLATLSGGHITTIPRHTATYTTTLQDGETLIIPAISATRTEGSSYDLTLASVTPSPTDVAATATESLGGGQGEGAPVTSAPATTTTAASQDHSSDNNSPPAGTIAGGVVGGAAGLAVILLIAMLFMRWYRRKENGQHRALPPGTGDLTKHEPPPGPSPPGMAERAGLMPLISAVPGFFRHHDRSIAESSEPSERGFTRVSGRKLPSAFSEGMSSEAVASQQQHQNMPLAASGAGLQRNLSNTSSSYPESDSYGYVRTASPTSPTSPTSHSSGVPTRNSVHEMMTVSPGPQRLPQVHQGGPYTIAPSADILAASPPPATASLGRSDTPSSLRNSRFTEDM